VLREILKLKANCGRRQMNALCSACDTAGFYHRQKYLKLMDVHTAPELTK